MDELKMKADQKKDDGVKETSTSAQATKTAEKDTKLQSKASTSSNAEHDLDIFLLGDLGSDDEGPGNNFLSYTCFSSLKMKCELSIFER